jgi:hypothetical protein
MKDSTGEKGLPLVFEPGSGVVNGRARSSPNFLEIRNSRDFDHGVSDPLH